MRHVSRTHRVAHGWLFDRINLDPMIQEKYVDTRGQLADILTRGSFTRDEWDQLLQLFNKVDVSLFSRSQFISRIEDNRAMSKRQMQGKEEGETMRGIAKSRIAQNLFAFLRKIIHRKGVFTKVSRTDAMRRGIRTLRTRWVDVNKGDAVNTNHRSRFVAMEFNAHRIDGLFTKKFVYS